MGGYNAGEVASQMLTSFLRDELGRWLAEADGAPPAAVQQAMTICVDNANRAIFDSAQDNPRYAGMGTTLVLAVFRPEGVCLGHIGDSRAYRIRAGRIEQLTRDHSLLQEQLDAGLITPEQAQFAAHRTWSRAPSAWSRRSSWNAMPMRCRTAICCCCAPTACPIW
jgi:serine/threonine protein phosphatase PrpC